MVAVAGVVGEAGWAVTAEAAGGSEWAAVAGVGSVAACLWGSGASGRRRSLREAGTTERGGGGRGAKVR